MVALGVGILFTHFELLFPSRIEQTGTGHKTQVTITTETSYCHIETNVILVMSFSNHIIYFLSL
jgi:hypothetical protein